MTHPHSARSNAKMGSDLSTRTVLTVRVDVEMVARARATALGVQQRDPRFSLADLVESALRAEVARLESEYNRGRPWPARLGADPLRRPRLASEGTTERAVLTTRVRADLQSQVRATVRGIQDAHDEGFSLADLVESALRAEVSRLEHEYHDGDPWVIPDDFPGLRRGPRLGR